MNLDSKRYPYQLWDEEKPVFFTCPNCEAEYELDLSDLQEIVQDGTVLCECGCRIHVEHLLTT